MSFSDLYHALREGFFMFWGVLWSLVLGFGLSGAVQAFVSKEELRRALGDHRPAALARATGFGMASSSCSYAAAAMAKSLFQKGADFLAAMAFMFASTNLVLELGVVLVVLLGWQFAAAELAGGPLMIALLVLVGGLVLRRGLIEQARQHVQAKAAGAQQRGHGASGGGHGLHQHDHDVDGGDTALQALPWRVKLRSLAGWSDAAGYAMADLKMLRRDLALGFLIAGALAVLVPMDVWSAVFWQGHGAWTSVENVLVGPFIAVISFVCSIGNVPMAAALWHGGISFGGVVSFIFADLITVPLLLIYHKYYGGALTLRLLGLFWVVMAAAGLAVEGIFAALHLVPSTRPAVIVAESLRWNYTTVLNILFLGVFALLWWLARNGDRFGGGRGQATDPVCGMRVEVASAPASAERDGSTYWFCSEGCRDRFLERRSPTRGSHRSGPWSAHGV
jgi:uncharacterized membrane protein YraQ (UPF0718 family)/YHS domain-containing protein